MKKIVLPFVLFLSFAVQAQNELNEWMATGSAACFSKDAAKKDLNSFVTTFLSSELPQQKLLHKAFQRLHSTYLKKYEAYSEFNEIFTSGRYDCLTATALFSHVLDQLSFSYEIIETNYHIFIKVKTSNGSVLLETTDRWNGFITGEEAIASRIGDYQANELGAGNSKKTGYQYSFKLYQSILSDKLTALMYFNQAVKAYNHHDLVASATYLETSSNLYESPRCNELGALLFRTVIESSMDENTKATCLIHLKSLLVKKLPVVASN